MVQRRIVLIPAYEPDSRFPVLVKEVSLAGFLSIIVDNGSGLN